MCDRGRWIRFSSAVSLNLTNIRVSKEVIRLGSRSMGLQRGAKEGRVLHGAQLVCIPCPNRRNFSKYRRVAPTTWKNRAHHISLGAANQLLLTTVSDVELNRGLSVTAKVQYTMFGRNLRDWPRGNLPAGERAGGRRTFLTSAMAEHPESNISLEQHISVLKKAVTADGPARRCD